MLYTWPAGDARTSNNPRGRYKQNDGPRRGAPLPSHGKPGKVLGNPGQDQERTAPTARRPQERTHPRGNRNTPTIGQKHSTTTGTGYRPGETTAHFAGGAINPTSSPTGRPPLRGSRARGTACSPPPGRSSPTGCPPCRGSRACTRSPRGTTQTPRRKPPGLPGRSPPGPAPLAPDAGRGTIPLWGDRIQCNDTEISELPQTRG